MTLSPLRGTHKIWALVVLCLLLKHAQPKAVPRFYFARPYEVCVSLDVCSWFSSCVLSIAVTVIVTAGLLDTAVYGCIL